MANTSIVNSVLAKKAQSAFDIVWQAHEPAHGTDIVRRERIRAALGRAIAERLTVGDEDMAHLVRAGHVAVARADIKKKA